VPSRRTFAVALLLALSVGIAAVLWAGDHLTAAAPAPDRPPPAELAVRSLSIASGADGTLAAWFVPGRPRAGAVILLHGVRSNKRSMAARARFLSNLGLALLLVDLQAHGASSGSRITFGHREAADVAAAVSELEKLAPGERIGVLGVSLGAAAAVLSDAKPRYAAAVLESLYPTIEEAVAARLQMHLGVPGPWLGPLLLAQLGPRLDVRPEQLRPVDHVAAIAAPVLLVHGSLDRHTPLAQARRVYDAIRAPKSLYVVEGAAHVDLHAYAGAAYERRVGSFLAEHLRSESPAPSR